jgi:hypothetical protein
LRRGWSYDRRKLRPPNNEEQNEEEESIQYENPNVFSLSDDGICDGSFAKYFLLLRLGFSHHLVAPAAG